MAVIQTGSIVSDIRGSVGNETYGRNQGGLYVRARAGPAGPPSAEQDKVTAAMTAVSQAWSNQLTDQNRADWRAYAHKYPEPNRWGHATQTNGYSRYIAAHIHAHIEAQVVIDDDPSPFPPFPPPVLQHTADSGTGNVTIPMIIGNMPDVPDWAHVRIYWGDEVPAGVNFYGSPWRYAGFNLLVPPTWIWDPLILAYPGGLTQDNRLWVKFIIHDGIYNHHSPYHQARCTIT